jgi:hypothetical protein
MTESIKKSRLVLPHRARQALLTAHIMMSVALLGDSAGFLAVAIRASKLSDPTAVTELVRVLNMLSAVFGIPLSLGTLISGVALGLGTKWGLFRYPWVVAKLLLVVSVMAVGGFVIGPALAVMLAGAGDATSRLIAASAFDVCALALATGLGVFKPGRQFRSGVS